VAYLKLLTGLKNEVKVWDVSCGYGNVEIALENRSWRGHLIGTDIFKPCITWAQNNITRRNPGFTFYHADIYNVDYWPKGKQTSEEWLAAFDERDFDLVMAKSLFTHMLPQEFELYLKNISSRLKSGGKAVFTFFLLNDQQRQLHKGNKCSMDFLSMDGDQRFRVQKLSAPTAAVGYEESYLRERFLANAIHIETIHYGAWSGVENPLSGQDVVILKKM
jgi:SAM-dependent methyltransferase